MVTGTVIRVSPGRQTQLDAEQICLLPQTRPGPPQLNGSEPVSEKLAETDWAAAMVTVQVTVVLKHAPPQPMKVENVLAVAVRVTTVPEM